MAGPIRIAVLANASQAKRELAGTASAADRIGGRFSKMRLPALAVLGGIALGAKSATDAASDLNEEVSKSKQIFGNQAKDIEKFAGAAAQNLGQSKREALDAASTFGLIGQKAGLGGRETVKFSKTFVGLASDLASFNNTSPEQAIGAIGAAMRGESEPIRKYGVLLDDATLRNRALRLGLIKNVKQALTPQQKALAASREILIQTSKAQGDFARTADGAANKSRINAAAAENLKASLGQALLPAYTKVLAGANNLLQAMNKHPGATKAVIIVVAALATTILLANGAFKIYTATQKIAAINTARVAAGQKALNITMLANPVFLVVAAVVALVVGFVILYKRSERVREITDQVFGVMKKVGGFVKDVFIGYIRLLGTVWLTMGIFGVRAFRLLLTGAFAAFGGILAAADKGLGWIPGLGGKIGKARRAFKEFGDGTINVLQGVEDKLIGARAKVQDLGRAHAKPKIDTGDIDRANSRLQVLKTRLNSISLGVIPLNFGGGGTRTAPRAERLASSSRTVDTPTQVVINVKVDPTANPAAVGREVVRAIRAYYAVGGAPL